MARNGNNENETITGNPPPEIQGSVDDMDAIIDAEFEAPVTLRNQTTCPVTTSAYRFYEKVKERLPRWWQEFIGELDAKTGALKYRTIYQFAATKTKNQKQQEWIIGLMGQKPVMSAVGKRGGKKQYQVIPWIGDWRGIRANGFWAPDQPKKIKALASAIKNKLCNWDAIRSSGPYLVQEMGRYTRLAEQVDEFYGGQAFDFTKGPAEPENKARFYDYLEMQKAVTEMKIRLMKMWMLVHGVNPEKVEMTQVTNNTLNVQPQLTQAAVIDGMTQKELQAVKIAQMLQMHADNFKMPLPEKLLGKVVEAEPQKPAKSNGKESRPM